jgi:hypothetical protein
MKRILLLLILSAFVLNSFSQETTSQTDTLRKDALNVFMESTDYIRKEIPYVNYVRDIKDAGVYIISTSQNTGSGGKEYSYFFVGQHENAGMADTLKFNAGPDETSDEIRQKSVSTLKMGLMRYIARTPLAKYMKISFTEPLKATVSTDKWNSWVFRTSIFGYLEGEQSRKEQYLSGSLSGNKITEKWKVNINSSYSQDNSKYIVTDTLGNKNTYRGDNTSKSFRSLIVRSLNDHWSAGGTFRLGSSSYSNEKFYLVMMPGIEYDLFPYSESTRRQLRILYSAGYDYEYYIDTTIYNKMKEGLWMHSINADYQVVQKWGNINFTMGYSNYLHDWSKNNISGSVNLELRIAKGLSITLYGSAAAIHDQLSLVKENLALDEVLLRRKQLATQFEYFTSFGLTYTFGSIYNNVVNPRFGNSGGGGISISISE